MGKRGQVTIYIILGILIVGVIGLTLAFRERILPGTITIETVQTEFGPIREHIQECVDESANGPIREIALKGGQLTPKSYKLFNGTTVSYLCYNIKGQPTCYNKMLTISDMEKDLSQVINFNLQKCIDVNSFSSIFSGVTVSGQGMPKATVIINKENVQVDVTYPVVLTQKDITITENKFNTMVNLPLGDLYDVSQDIINVETEFGDFDQLIYMLSKTGKYMIYKHRPYPDKLYQIKRTQTTDGLMFQFFVEGEPS